MAIDARTRRRTLLPAVALLSCASLFGTISFHAWAQRQQKRGVNAAGCAYEARPYHTILTSSSGSYQTWQCRIMYHHWRMQRARDPCGEMGGFTRLLSSAGGVDDGKSFTDEIPTFIVHEHTGAASRGYVVVNRPYALLQFVAHPEFARRVVEEYIFIGETDHVLLRPMPNLATSTIPAAHRFSYMRVSPLNLKILERLFPGLSGRAQPTGPSPIIIHKVQLAKLVGRWFNYTLVLGRDDEARRAFGWVREMWAWSLAAAHLHMRHRLIETLQYEGGREGGGGTADHARERPVRWPVAAAPVTADRLGMPYYMFHYTYGLEYTLEGLLMELQLGEWSLDKRHYMTTGRPPSNLTAPPACAHESAHVLHALWANATAMLHRWDGQVEHAPPMLFTRMPYRGGEGDSMMALAGTGPWRLVAGGGIRTMWLLRYGYIASDVGYGRWGVGERVHKPNSYGKAAERDGEERYIDLELCRCAISPDLHPSVAFSHLLTIWSYAVRRIVCGWL